MDPNALAQPSMLDLLAKELAGRMGSKAVVSTTPQGPYMHGPNGLWSYPGLSQAVISTRVRPRGLAGRIPARATNVENPLYPYFTGFTSPAETQANGVCDDPPTAGQTKNCFQTAVFGRYGYQTRVIDITRLGQIINRSEFTDFNLWNNPLGLSEGSQGLTWPGSAPSQLALNNEVSVRMAEVGVMFQNKLMRQLWYGNPANNTGGGGYQEFSGLERLVRTGVRDAVTNALCPSLDSLVLNQNYKNVTNLAGEDNIVNVLTYTMHTLRDTATRMGMDPVEWVIVMRASLFYEITAQWPCNYLTYRCVTMNGNANVDVGDAIAMRDAMRNGRYLVIDGVQVQVELDDAIDEQTSGDTNRVPGGSYASDIKILPLTVQGNKAVLFWEYFDFAGPNAALSPEVTNEVPLMRNWYWSDGGQYLWHFKPPANWCIQWLGLIKPRVVLLTPHLAADIQNVLYKPLMHERDAFPDDPYFQDGGATSRDTAPSLYKP
jgi:hypothetical protein